MVGFDILDSVLPESVGQTEVCVRVLSGRECPIGFSLDIVLHVTDDNATSGS